MAIFFLQKAAALKKGAEYHQKSIGAIRCSLAMLYNNMRGRARCLKFWSMRVNVGGGGRGGFESQINVQFSAS